MRDFNKGGKKFTKHGNDRQMHDAVCSNCGKKCQVPFRPTLDKPIYCNDCFAQQSGRDNRDPSDKPRRSFRGLGGSNKPFNRGNRPFKKDFNRPPKPSPDYQKQLDAMDKKLDLILKTLNPSKPQTKSDSPKVIPQPDLE